ncbi:MAG: mechanosensitive ion channel family protein [Candidatus Melainabacteria bacterium]
MDTAIADDIFALSFYGNTLKQWLIALSILLVTFIILKTMTRVVGSNLLKLAKKTATDWDDIIADLVLRINNLFIAALALFASSYALEFPVKISKLITVIPILAFLLQLAFWGYHLIDVIVRKYTNRYTDVDQQMAMKTMMVPIRYLAQAVLLSVLGLLALDNMGVDVTALIAGLGVGGIVVAFGLQNMVKDLFSAFTIAMDQPFVIGDFIIVDDKMGNVEKIGLKSTRIKSIEGEQIIFPNSDLLASRIRNCKRMPNRRVQFRFGVQYDTPYDLVEAIPGMVREILETVEKVTIDRIHFAEFGDSSLEYEVAYFIGDADFAVYREKHQKLLLGMMRAFQARGIEFAFPTRTLHIASLPENSAEGVTQGSGGKA